MKKLTLLLAALGIIALTAMAADDVVGKKGQTLPVQDQPAQPSGGSPLLADVEYSTGGAIDTPATTGGSNDGWGSHFIAAWYNDTGQDVTLVEFGWPCGGPGPVEWVVWLTEGMPGAPGTQTFSGLWTPASGDPDELPPSTYSYVDISGEGIMVPAGTTFYFGYENPGIGGQLSYNGVETWAWYEGMWDPDSGWGRTALLQFKGNFGILATENRTLGQVKTLFR